MQLKQWLPIFLFLSLSPRSHGAPEGRILEVDRNGSGKYTTIAAAAKDVRPGDTIRLKPGSGPYREMVEINTSGTEGNPVVFDGGNNVVTAFDEIVKWEEKDGVTSCRIGRWPIVITYKGERLVEDYATGKFTKYASYSASGKKLTLRPGVEKSGWEYSRRWCTFIIKNVSHQTYRNVRASGAYNDGFNLHGKGTNLVFENIEGFHNIDEGFSAHDAISCTIRGGKFWGNDNGIANSADSLPDTRETVSTVLEDVDCFDNLGRGLVLHDCAATLSNVRCWNNGVIQAYFYDASVKSSGTTVYTPPFKTRPFASYKDTKGEKSSGLTYEAKDSTVTGEAVAIRAEPSP